MKAVRYQAKLKNLLQHLNSFKSAVVVGHQNADLDAVASASALGLTFGWRIGFPTSVSREGKWLLKKFRISYEIDPSVEGTDLVVVDTSKRDMLTGIDIEKARSVTVIDHHKLPPDIEGKLFIFPDRSSTSEIVLDLLEMAGYKNSLYRELLLYGILYDTKNLLLARGSLLKKIGDVLGKRSVLDVIWELEKERSLSERIAALKSLRKGRILNYGNILIAISKTGSYEAAVADTLLYAGADIAIGYSSSSKGDRLSVRLSKRAQEMGISLSKLFKGILGCGGHEASGGCHLPPQSAENIVEELIERAIKESKERGVEAVLREY